MSPPRNLPAALRAEIDAALPVFANAARRLPVAKRAAVLNACAKAAAFNIRPGEDAWRAWALAQAIAFSHIAKALLEELGAGELPAVPDVGGQS